MQRRSFLTQSAAAGVAMAMAADSVATAAKESEKFVVAVIGPGGMGSNHLRLLASRKDVEVAYVCDVDQNRLAAAAKEVETRSGKSPRTETDMRRVFDDKAIEAVFIATPDHWHAPAAIMALDAGKHVYVEKPCCHNVREGRLLADAVHRTGKRLQVGTQSRSTPMVRDGIARLQAGDIGEVLVAKAWNSQLRRSIGKVAPSDPPPHLNFDLWCGPAPRVAYRANLLPGVWRWWYDFGCGDIGNDGVHDIDVALWGLGVTTHPTTVACLGGKHFFDDDQQFPDTQYSVSEFAADATGRKKQMIFEQRIWSPYVQEGYENGAAFYGTKGMMLLGHTRGWKLFGPRNQLIAEQTGNVDLPAHHQNFFDCIRDPSKSLNADVTAGTLATGIVHLSNIAARVGKTLHFDPQTEQITNAPDANELLKRQYRAGHWATPRGV